METGALIWELLDQGHDVDETSREIEAKFARIWPVLARIRNLVSIFDLLG